MNETAEFLQKQNWTFAKTYADRAPHEYIVRGKVSGMDQEFADAVIHIRENGIPMHFWGQEYIYLYLDGRLYWTMGEPIEETTIINRCDLDDCDITVSPKARENMAKTQVLKDFDAICRMTDSENRLGFEISESNSGVFDEPSSYKEIGRSLIEVLQNNRNQAELIEKVIIAITGWNIRSLRERMEEHKSYIDSLCS